LAQQAAFAGHAEHTAHRATDLAGDAQTIARQQYAFHHLLVGQLHQQTRRAVRRRVFRAETRQSIKFAAYLGQGIAYRQRQEVLGLLVARTGIQRHAAQPGTGNPPDVHGLGTEIG